MVMIDAYGREKWFIASLGVTITHQAEKFIYAEHDDMIRHRDALQDVLTTYINAHPELRGANVDVSIPSYACGTEEALKKSGEWVK
jgi:hypothetical protein